LRELLNVQPAANFGEKQMKKPLFIALCVLCVVLVSASAFARETVNTDQERYSSPTRVKASVNNGPLFSAASQGTTVLGEWEFDSGPTCITEGWTAADLTAQVGDFVHVDDFAGLGGGTFGILIPLQGTQSLWIGARPDAGSSVLCGYATLPGYGNGWDQALCSDCFVVSGDVDLSYHIAWDS
jgi:hypothetical protein